MADITSLLQMLQPPQGGNQLSIPNYNMGAPTGTTPTGAGPQSTTTPNIPPFPQMGVRPTMSSTMQGMPDIAKMILMASIMAGITGGESKIGAIGKGIAGGFGQYAQQKTEEGSQAYEDQMTQMMNQYLDYYRRTERPFEKEKIELAGAQQRETKQVPPGQTPLQIESEQASLEAKIASTAYTKKLAEKLELDMINDAETITALDDYIAGKEVDDRRMSLINKKLAINPFLKAAIDAFAAANKAAYDIAPFNKPFLYEQSLDPNGLFNPDKWAANVDKWINNKATAYGMPSGLGGTRQGSGQPRYKVIGNNLKDTETGTLYPIAPDGTVTIDGKRQQVNTR